MRTIKRVVATYSRTSVEPFGLLPLLRLWFVLTTAIPHNNRQFIAWAIDYADVEAVPSNLMT